MILRALSLLALLCVAPAARAVECSDLSYAGNRYTLCEVDASKEQLRLFLRDDKAQIFGHFSSIEESLAAEGKTLAFATNGGMYHANRSPVGLYIEQGQEEMRLITNAGPGNFGLLPNGVFCLREGRADVIETLAYRDSGMACASATQSGPMLVIDGALHPRFLPGSTSYYIRNGVGTSRDGRRVVFAISRKIGRAHV